MMNRWFYPLFGSIGFQLLDLTHDCGQALTCFFVLQVVLLRVPAVQLRLLVVDTYILNEKNKLNKNPSVFVGYLSLVSLIVFKWLM